MEISELSKAAGSSPTIDHKRAAPALSSPSTSSPKRPKLQDAPESSSQPSDLPDAASLYHFAYSSWESAHRHLTQAFIPATVGPASSSAEAIRLVGPSHPERFIAYQPDPEAALKVLSLQLLALDALKIGLGMSNLPDKDRVALGTLFGKIGLQVLTGLQAYEDRKGKKKETGGMGTVDREKLVRDVEEQVNRSMAIARKSTYLILLLHQLELLSIRILLYQGKTSFAKRSVKQASAAAHAYPGHMYALSLLLLEHEDVLGPAASLVTVDDVIEKYAKYYNHDQVCQILLLARIRLLFHYRRWDILPATLDELGATIGWKEDTGLPTTIASAPNPEWLATIAVHFLLYKCLWEGRRGKPERVKQLRKQTFGLMDEASECRAFASLRHHGGLLEVPIHHQGYNTYILVQTTPPSVLYTLTYHVALVSGRDVSGKEAKAKALVYSNAMLQTADTARADDMWDMQFSHHHGLGNAMQQQRQIVLIRAGVMLEQAFALIYRSSFAAGDKVLDETINLLRDRDLFGQLATHILLLRAQCSHLIGQGHAALRYYRAGLDNLVPGSELGLAYQIGLLGCSGQLEDPTSTPEVETQIKAIIEQARHSTNSSLVGAGHFLSSLLETGAVAKTKLRSAFQETHANADKLLYVLLYAFLASVDVSGEFERVAGQLGTGMSLARAMGGLDRPDGVGNGALGAWYAHRLSKLYKHVNHERYDQVVDSLKKHKLRNYEDSQYGIERYGSVGRGSDDNAEAKGI